MTFDFETVNQNLNVNPKSNTKLMAWILPHTVAATIDKKTEIYFDTRNGKDFVHQLVAEIFDQAKLLSQRRVYDNIPGVNA
jgi:hypothetical protein